MIDAAVSSVRTEGKYYFFRGSHYVRYTHGVGVDPGYPRPIDWRGMAGLFPPPYDTVIRHVAKPKYYFFRGDRYMRYTSGVGADWPASRSIADRWRDLWQVFPGPYDTALLGRKNNRYYFFKGDRYVRYKPGSGIEKGPKRIGWHGLWEQFPGPYNAACSSADSDGRYYFFRGNQYVRYRRNQGIDNPKPNKGWRYPLTTAYAWAGLWVLQDILPPSLGAYTQQGPLVWTWQRHNQPISLVHNTEHALQTIREMTHPQLPGVVKVSRVRNMAPGSRKLIRMVTDDGEFEPIVVRAPPTPVEYAELTLLHCSCLDDARHLVNDVPTLRAAIRGADETALMVWGGDTSYYTRNRSTKRPQVLQGDMRSTWAMFTRMFKTRLHPSVAALMQCVPAVSSWDDHDFAYNNANGTQMDPNLVSESSSVFRTMWPNDYWHGSTRFPLGSSTRYGQIEVFLPDTRSCRNGHNRILGTDQAHDLLRRMNRSDAAVKVLVLSSQFIPQRKPSGENFWNKAPDERTILLNGTSDLSGLSGMSGRVLILSGDVHYSELTRHGPLERPRLLEVTSSPLLLRRDSQASTPYEDVNNVRVWSVRGENYVRISIAFVNERPRITISCLDETGDLANIYDQGNDTLGYDSPQAEWDENGTLSERR